MRVSRHLWLSEAQVVRLPVLPIFPQLEWRVWGWGFEARGLGS